MTTDKPQLTMDNVKNLKYNVELREIIFTLNIPCKMNFLKYNIAALNECLTVSICLDVFEAYNCINEHYTEKLERPKFRVTWYNRGEDTRLLKKVLPLYIYKTVRAEILSRSFDHVIIETPYTYNDFKELSAKIISSVTYEDYLKHIYHDSDLKDTIQEWVLKNDHEFFLDSKNTTQEEYEKELRKLAEALLKH